LKASKLSLNLLYHAIFLLLAIASLIFYKERLFVDSSYYIFKSINEGWFHIEHGRSILALSQILPLLGKAIGLPLQWLLVLYSFGQLLFFYSIFLLLHHHFKMRWAALCIPLIMLIGQKWLYFIPMLEIAWGGLMAILVMAIMRSDRWKDDKWLLIMIFAWWFLLTSHPLNYLTAAILIIYDLSDRKLIKKLHFSLIGLFAAALFVELIGSDSYENQKVIGFEESTLQLLVEPGFLLKSLILIMKKYWLIILIGLWSSIRFISKEKWLAAMLWPASMVAIYLAGLYRWDLSQDNWYTEVILQPAVTISSLLFALSLVEKASNRFLTISSWTFGLIFLGYGIAIFYQVKPMQNRTAQIEKIIEAMPAQKGVIQSANFARPYQSMEWSVPVEALLISACDGAESAVSLVTELDMNYTNHSELLTDSSFLFRRFERMDYEDLDSDYFVFKKSSYQKLNSEEGIEGLKSRREQIRIIPSTIDQIIKIPSQDTSWVKIGVFNSANQPIPSALSTNLFMATHWFHADTLYRWDGARTPLQMDVKDSILQDIRLRAPEKRGIYQIQFDMVKEGEYWMELKQRFTVQVF